MRGRFPQYIAHLMRLKMFALITVRILSFPVIRRTLKDCNHPEERCTAGFTELLAAPLEASLLCKPIQVIAFTCLLSLSFDSYLLVIYSWGIGTNGQLGHAKFQTVGMSYPQTRRFTESCRSQGSLEILICRKSRGSY